MAMVLLSLAAATKFKVRMQPQDVYWWIALVSLVAILSQEVIVRTSAKPSPSSFEGFDGFGDELDEEEFEGEAPVVVPPPIVRPPGFENERGPPVSQVKPEAEVDSPAAEEVVIVEKELPEKTKSSQEYWDEDEFEGLPVEVEEGEQKVEVDSSKNSSKFAPSGPQNYYMEVVSVVFLVAYGVKYFLGKKENEKIALAWAAEYASKGSIFDKNFSLLGTGEGEDAAILMKEGQNVFKFYASGRRYCQGLLATMDLKSRHDLISCLWYSLIPRRDEITIDVLMNDENMDAVLLAVARRKNAKAMNKEFSDLQQCAIIQNSPSQQKWVHEELSVISESREVARDLISDSVLDLAFGEKAYEKFGSNFISMHFSDMYPFGAHKKVLQFRFYLPAVDRMSDMSRLIQLVPHFIDAVGRYKLSPQARSKGEPARKKLAQEALKEARGTRLEMLARKKDEKRKAAEEVLSPEALRKKEEKERLKQMKKSVPRMRVARSH